MLVIEKKPVHGTHYTFSGKGTYQKQINFILYFEKRSVLSCINCLCCKYFGLLYLSTIEKIQGNPLKYLCLKEMLFKCRTSRTLTKCLLLPTICIKETRENNEFATATASCSRRACYEDELRGYTGYE